MTVPVPAGAGGVDREAIRADLAEIESYETASLLNAPGAAMRVLRAVPALLAALAAAEQRADTLAAAVAEAERYCEVAWDRDIPTSRVIKDVRAALSSRPVQPEGKQR